MQLQRALRIPILIFCLVNTSMLVSISNVYNLKIRTSFDTLPQLRKIKPKWIITVLPVFTMRSRHIMHDVIDVYEKRSALEAVGNIRYGSSKYWWIEFTTGIAREKTQFFGNDPFKACRIGLDDLVFEGGYRIFIPDKTQISVYGLGGIPTTKKVTLNDRQDPLIGVRVYRLGAGSELAYSFFDTVQRSLSAALQARLIHGFKRSWFPILPCGSLLQPGNFIDVLGLVRFRKKHTLLELGYIETFFNNQATITSLKITKDKPHTTQSGFLSLQHGYRIDSTQSAYIVRVGISASHSNYFDEKAFGMWLGVTVLF